VIIAMKSDPAKQHPVLVAFRSLDDLASERVLVDPDQIDPTHTTNFDFFAPSTDRRYLAVSLSAGGSVAWNTDSRGFFYTRYPRGTPRS
jgi:prolyl oligopeptidase